MESFTLVREGMRIEFNVPIKTRSGRIVRANIFHPLEEGKYPVIFNYGIYGKDLHFQDGYPDVYERIRKNVPDYFVNTTGTHHCWEILDPEKWCKDGYVIARIDSKGTGQSEGYMDPYCHEEAEDVCDCIEYFAAQPWCNGKVGMSGTSYHSVTMWNAASLQPEHLTAFCAWEGHTDIYRDNLRHGGILSSFQSIWFKKQPSLVQNGRGKRGYTSRVTGLPVSGDKDLTDSELAANRISMSDVTSAKENELITDWHRGQSADVTKIKAAYIAVVNWGGQGLHMRGSVDAFVHGGSKNKYMLAISGPHGDLYFSDKSVNLQKKFFGYYLKGEDTGWDKMPPVTMRVRKVGEPAFSDKHEYRSENEFPLARTQYTKFYLDCSNYGLTTDVPTAKGTITYKGMSSDGVTFMSQPLEKETEITGYIASKLFISADTNDADLFVTVRAFAPDMKEVVFSGANAENIPVAIGWLRASHRKLDPEKTTEFRPYHTHDELWPLKPGEIAEMDVEVWPTNIVLPKGYRIAVTIKGKDHVYTGYIPLNYQLKSKYDEDVPQRIDGLGPMRHTDPIDRPPEIFDNNVTLHFDEDKRPYIMLPIIPAK